MSDYNIVDMIKSHIQTNNTRLYTQLPATVNVFYEDTNCVDVTLLISDTLRGNNVVQAAKLINVPVMFPSGGTFQQGFKLLEGDNVLINFCMRSLDKYHLTDGKKVTVMDNRRYHDVSDAFATLGAFTKKSPVVSEEFKGYSYLLDGSTSIVFNKDGEGLTVTSDQDITLNAEGSAKVIINGNLEVNGTVDATGDVKAGLISLQTHNHGYVNYPAGTPTPTPATTSPPT